MIALLIAMLAAPSAPAYDSAAVDAMPLSGGTLSGALHLNDSIALSFGNTLAAPDVWFDNNGTAMCFTSTSVDAGGTDGDLFCYTLGGNALTITANTTFNGQQSSGANIVTCATATDDFDINWNNGNIAHLDMEDCDQDANDINAPTNPIEGASYAITIEQSTAGTEDLTWNAVFLFPGGTDPTLTQTNNARDVVTCLYVDSVYHCTSSQDFQ